MNFERKFIDPILNIIKNNQDYLCQRENLPQLAKLGYIYNTLWYAGRVCWGYEGILKKRKGGYVCENNPKYKIEMCEPNCQEHDDLIYDAWGMHLDDDMTLTNWDKFSKIVFDNTEYSDFDIKFRKINKTFDEWVELLTDKRYKYSSMFSNRISVANHLLCVIGNGFGYKNGFVIKEASGADQDENLYGFWENVQFPDKIAKKIKRLLFNPIVEQTLNECSTYIAQERKKRKREDNRSEVLKIALIVQKYITADEADQLDEDELENVFYEMVKKDLKTKVSKKPFSFYPISTYSIITQFDEKTHPSYIEAAIEVCKRILEDQELYEPADRKPYVMWAKKLLKKYEKF